MSEPKMWCYSTYAPGHEAPAELIQLAKRNNAFLPAALVESTGGALKLKTGDGNTHYGYLHDEKKIAHLEALLQKEAETPTIYAPAFGLLVLGSGDSVHARGHVFHLSELPTCPPFALDGVCHPNSRGHRANMHKHMWMHNHRFPGFKKAELLYIEGLEIAIYVHHHGLVIGWLHDPGIASSFHKHACSNAETFFMYRPGGRELTCHTGGNVQMANLAETSALCLLDSGLARKYAATGTVYHVVRPGEPSGYSVKDPFERWVEL